MTAGLSDPGEGGGDDPPPQILTTQLTLTLPEGADYASQKIFRASYGTDELKLFPHLTIDDKITDRGHKSQQKSARIKG